MEAVLWPQNRQPLGSEGLSTPPPGLAGEMGAGHSDLQPHRCRELGRGPGSTLSTGGKIYFNLRL